MCAHFHIVRHSLCLMLVQSSRNSFNFIIIITTPTYLGRRVSFSFVCAMKWHLLVLHQSCAYLFESSLTCFASSSSSWTTYWQRTQQRPLQTQVFSTPQSVAAHSGCLFISSGACIGQKNFIMAAQLIMSRERERDRDTQTHFNSINKKTCGCDCWHSNTQKSEQHQQRQAFRHMAKLCLRSD